MRSKIAGFVYHTEAHMRLNKKVKLKQTVCIRNLKNHRTSQKKNRMLDSCP